MLMRRRTTPDSALRVLDVERAEAALVEHYARLVRLVYVTLPRRPGRHRRVLAAHGLVQRALPRRGLVVPGQRQAVDGRTDGAHEYDALRTRVLRAALSEDARRGRRSRAWVRRPGRPVLPRVWGLRVFPQAGGADELALDHALAKAGWPVRAACALLVLEGLPSCEATGVLRDVGVEQPERALRAARRLVAEAAPRDTRADEGASPARSKDAGPNAVGPPGITRGEAVPGNATPVAATAAPALLAPEFDPCLLHARPTDLLRRRHRVRATGAALLAGAVALGLLCLSVGGDDGGGTTTRRSGTSHATDVGLLNRTPADAWADTARVDFTAWPARGGRTGDRVLLDRALRAWSDPAWQGRRVTEPGAAPVGSGRAPRLLFAGDVDDRAVVVLLDGLNTVRYSEPLRGDGPPPELSSALTEGADVTTAAAIVVARTPRSVRLLLAPWIAEADVRDLLAPDTPARAVHRFADGLTEPVPLPPAAGDCRERFVVQLRSSPRIVENHAFLLADLGGMSPAHLTYMPPPEPGVRPRSPREATGPAALRGWARAACRLDGLRGQGVRAVNHWVFATQTLPERAGKATWVCARADTWQGPGRVEYLFLGPDTRSAARAVGGRRNTAECSRFGQDVLAHTDWRAPSGTRYLLAAGSRSVTRVEASGSVRAAAQGPLLAVRGTGGGADAKVTGRLRDGNAIPSAE